ncbi:MAG: MBL fold metallo-hydrolase [Pseudooceanicola sp.]
MQTIETPVQLPAQRVSDSWTALPAWMPVPGLGALPVNAFLLKGPEPMLVDTGLSALSDALVARLSEEVDLDDLRWIWLSHTDADHIGNLGRILDMAPKAQVVTNFLGAGKMGMLGAGDPSRLRPLDPDEVFEVGGHRLHQVKPPYYDAPETMGFFDEAERVFFAADAFGALLEGVAEDLDMVPDAALRDGLVAWSSVDAPWLASMDRRDLGQILRGLERLAPETVLSGHLPVARSLATLTGIVRTAYGRGETTAVSPETARQVEAILG